MMSCMSEKAADGLANLLYKKKVIQAEDRDVYKNKPLTDGQKIMYRKKALRLSIMWLILAIAAKAVHTTADTYILYAFWVVAISLIIPQERRKPV